MIITKLLPFPGVLRSDNLVLNRRPSLPRRADTFHERRGQHLRELEKCQHKTPPPHREMGQDRAEVLVAMDTDQRGRV